MTSLVDANEDPLIGTEIGGYRLAEQIGRGGMGVVYRAVQSMIDAEVAIKILSAELAGETESVERFIAEAKTANLVRHEGLVKVLALGVLPDGRPYQVMEHLTGKPLSRLIRERPLPVGSVCTRLAETLRAIGAVHAKGIIHRDLKPSNLFVTTAGFIKVLDFGIAKLASEHRRLTRTGHFIGTPGYMSPEQADAAPVDARTDIYSMGIVLYESIAGAAPFEGRVIEALALRESPPVLAGVLPALDAIVQKAMAIEPRDRFADAIAMADALDRVATELPRDTFGPLFVVTDTEPTPVEPRSETPPTVPLGSPTVTPPTVPLGPRPIQRLGRYIVEDTVGRGGGGTVMRGIDPAVQRKVALKLVRAEGAAHRERALAEARAMARINHPNVVTLFELGEDGDQLFLAMEYFEAIDLQHWIDSSPRSWRDILDRFVEAGRGLDAAHAAGVVHRDFKPANVLLANSGRAKVGDFGIARAGGELHEPQGTAAYMAPEQLEAGIVDPRADQFAFCASLWHALHGELPYDELPVAAAVAAHRGELRAPRNRDVPASINAALRRGLAPQPEARFASMTKLLAALTARKRSPLAIGAIVLGVLAIAVVAVWVASGTEQPKVEPAARPLGLDDIVAMPSTSDQLRALAALPREERISDRARAITSEAALAGYVRTFHVPDPPIMSPADFAMSPSGRSLAVGTRAGVWIQRVEGAATKLASPGEITALAIDDRGVRAAIGDGVVEAPLAGGPWRPTTACKPTTANAYRHDRELRHLVCHEIGGSWLYSIDDGSRVAIDASDSKIMFGPAGRRMYQVSYDQSSITTTGKLHALPESARLAVGDELLAIVTRREITVWEPSTGREATWRGEFGDTIAEPALIEGTHPRIAVTGVGGRSLVLLIGRAKELVLIPAAVVGAQPQRFVTTGERLATVFADHVVVDDHASLGSWSLPGAPGLVVADRGGERFALLDDRTVRVWDVSLRAASVISGRAIRLSGPREHWAVSKSDDRLRWYDTEHPVRSIAETPVSAGSSLLFGSVPGTIYFIDRGVTMAWQPGSEPRVASRRSDIAKVYAVGSARIALLRNDTLIDLADDSVRCGGAVALAVSNGTALLAGSTTQICDLATGRLVPLVDVPRPALRWSLTLDGSIASANSMDRAYLFDTATGARIPNPRLAELDNPGFIEGTRDRLFVAGRDGLHMVGRGRLALFGSTAALSTTYDGGAEAFVISDGDILAIDVATAKRRTVGHVATAMMRLPSMMRLGSSLVVLGPTGLDEMTAAIWPIDPVAVDESERWLSGITR